MLKQLKNGWDNNGLYVPNNETNNDYQEIKKYIDDGGEYEKFDWLTDAKLEKINELKVNFDIASKKPYPLKDVKQIDKVGNVIKTIDAFYNIADASSLTDSANIIFAGTFMKMQGFLKVLCASLKIDYNTILTQVNGLSDNPATEKVANIPYTTKDKDGNEVRILLSFAKIQEIFAHIFTRVANAGNSFNIIEEQIKKVSTIEELEKININIIVK
jgi:hypothetical protein